MVHTNKNKNTNIKSIINKIFESENPNNINKMISILSESPFGGSENSGTNPFGGSENSGTNPFGGSETNNGGGQNNNQNNNNQNNNNQNNNNSTISNQTTFDAAIAAGFPKCIAVLSNLNGTLNNQKEMVVNYQSVTYTFKTDGTYKRSDNTSGTWKCNGDKDVTVIESGGSNNNQQSGGDWMTGFPECVKSFKQSNPYLYTNGKDNKGVEVEIFFTKVARQGGNYAAISRPIGSRDASEQVKLSYNCNNGLKITDIYGLEYTVGPVGMSNTQQSNLTSEQSETYNMVTETNNFLGLKVIMGNYRLNTVELTQATEAVISGINSKYRSNGFGYYATFLENLIEFYSSMGEKYQRYVTTLNENFTQVKGAMTNATNELAQTSNQSNWNPLTNPPQKDIMNYTEVKFDKAPFTTPFTAYVLKGQNMTKNATANIDANLSKYMEGNKLTAEFCKTTISKLLDCIQYQETGLFKKKAESVTSCEAFEIGELKAMKQVVANCARKRIITDRNQISALSDEGLEDRYKVSFASMKSMDQPPLQ
jgi:hypothetical protein